MIKRSVSTLGLLFVALAGCTVDNPAFVESQTVCAADEFYVRQNFEFADPDKVDILFVVENSAGSLANQQALADAMPGFVNALNGVEALDWRLAVASTDLATDGAQLLTGTPNQEGCPTTRQAVLSRSVTNAALQARCNVVVGESGDSITQGFQAARLALAADNDFARPDARLVIVFFSRRDDCTTSGNIDRSNPDSCVQNPSALYAVEDFGAYFAGDAREAAGNPVSIVAITGPDDGRVVGPTDPVEPACTGLSPAWAGRRYAAMADYGDLARHSNVYNICTSSFSGILEEVFAHNVLTSDDAVCLGAPMSGAPERVVLSSGAEGATSVDLSEAGDFLTLGSTADCANGEVAISTAAHDSATGHRAEIWFCSETDPYAQ